MKLADLPLKRPFIASASGAAVLIGSNLVFGVSIFAGNVMGVAVACAVYLAHYWQTRTV